MTDTDRPSPGEAHLTGIEPAPRGEAREDGFEPSRTGEAPEDGADLSSSGAARADDVRRARVALSWLVEPGSRDLYALVAAVGPERALELVVDGHPEGASSLGGVVCARLRGAAAARLRAGDPWAVAETALAHAERVGARVVVPEDDEWPVALDDLVRLSREDPVDRTERDTLPPLCLYVRGPRPLAEVFERAVAVVGARAATSYGTHTAGEFAYGLAERGWTVVSGGAYGIDAAAHRGALHAGGSTAVVYACGIDRAYPMGHASLFERVAEDGLLLSEWPIGAEPFRHRFLVRNRVIAALTRGTVVVEASIRSGASQTLRRATQLGRRPMAVPGPVSSQMSAGCHRAIRDLDARLVTSAADVIEEIGRIGDDLAPIPRGPERPRDRLAPAEARLVDAVPARGTATVETIAARAGLPVRDVLRMVPGLVLRGFLDARDGGVALAAPPKPRGKSSDRPSTARGASRSAGPLDRP